MKTKFVYVVVSDETSLYLEQAVVSAYSVRLYNPSAYIEVVIDTNTAETLNGKRHFVYNYFDKVTVIETPSDYSKEEPYVNLAVDEETGKRIPASISFVPSVVGLIIAGEVIKDLSK